MPIFKFSSIRFKIILAITLCYPSWITAQINSKDISAYFNNLRLIKSGSYTFNKVYTSPFNKVPTREVYKIWFNEIESDSVFDYCLYNFSKGIYKIKIGGKCYEYNERDSILTLLTDCFELNKQRSYFLLHQLNSYEILNDRKYYFMDSLNKTGNIVKAKLQAINPEKRTNYDSIVYELYSDLRDSINKIPICCVVKYSKEELYFEDSNYISNLVLSYLPDSQVVLNQFKKLVINSAINKSTEICALKAVDSLMFKNKVFHFSFDTILFNQNNPKPVLFFFWYKGCPYCYDAFSVINKLNEKYKNRIYIIGVNTKDQNEVSIKKYLALVKPNFNAMNFFNKMGDNLSINGYPCFQFVNIDGGLDQRIIGIGNNLYEELENHILFLTK
ncbi:MAG: redoxin domain-containing protein [Bacteroidetes bacterium]|nr:redoxin domain-containing protein [Bacteroidota bacterium]